MAASMRKCARPSLTPPASAPRQIGNWDRQGPQAERPPRRGFALLGRALGDAEIKALYDAGNPYR